MGKDNKQPEQSTTTPEPPKQEAKPVPEPTYQCPDCKGQGIRNPAIDHQVCQTCQGTGKA